MDSTTATTPPPYMGAKRDDSPKAWSRFDRSEARARLFGTFYAGKHRAEATR